jgi:putative lipoic acid-binding regulatory protein
MTDSETLLEFPCQFPIKAIGRGNDLEERLFELINPHAPDLDKTTMTSRPSGKGNFIAVTVIITATSQDQIDAIYHELTRCEQVIMAL